MPQPVTSILWRIVAGGQMAGAALRNVILGTLTLVASVGGLHAGGSWYPGSPEARSSHSSSVESVDSSKGSEPPSAPSFSASSESVGTVSDAVSSPDAAGGSMHSPQPIPMSEEARQTLFPAIAPRRPVEADGIDLRRMIGQMLVVGFPGAAVSEAWPARAIRWVEEGKIGGVLLLGHNVISPGQLKMLTSRLSEAGASIRPLIAVDQEGGAVQRLTREKGFRGLASAGEIARTADPIAALTIYARQADELAANGINVNLGPVVDLAVGTWNPVIGGLDRTYGALPDAILPYANAFIDAHRQKGVLIAAKHFPGHGSSAQDPHLTSVNVSNRWTSVELRPFMRLAKSDRTSMIMVGHLILDGFSDGKRPTSLSHQAVTERLRKGLGFEGLIVTDDLEMGAISDEFSLEEAFVLAVAAGNDVVVYANKRNPDPDLADKAIDAIVRAVSGGRIPRSQIEQSYRRILSAKSSLAKFPEPRSMN
jgi:beta-N-acetylhexosaminidase